MSKSTLLKNVFPCVLLFFSLSFTINMSAQGTEAMIDQALQEMVAKGELTADDIDEYRMTDHYVSKGNGVDHMYFCQTYNGIDIHNAVGSMHVLSNGNVLTKNVGFSRDFESRMTGSQSPSLGVLRAVSEAAKAKGYNISENLQILSQEDGPDQFHTISKGGISLENITAKLKYVDTGKAVRLTWEVSIYELGGANWFNLRVDANNGELLDEDNMVDTCFEELFDHNSHDHGSPLSNKEENKGFNPLEDPLAMFAPDSYNVYAWPNASPHDDGGVARTIEVDPAHPTGSPFGWHDIDGMAGAEFTTTQGNNTHTYADRNDDNIPDVGSDPDGGMTLDFNFPIDLSMAPITYQPASVTNLFYWTNIMHDITYLYGFDEAAGNFQVNNYGNGGLGGDPVLSEAQDAADAGGNCNANFATPPDGSSGRNQMFTCDIATPDRDGSLDAEVITHEIGHGVSNRLVGGPMNTSCLNNDEQMGEGWSDYMSLIHTIKMGDNGADPRTVGTWLLGSDENGPGVRTFPYSTDMVVNPQTYNSIIGTGPFPHPVGEVWNMMLWEMTWALIDVHGLNENIYDDWTTGGNNLAMQLVMDGMKLTACSPGFVDGRDAILAADVALTGGANQCTIWEAFAKRGLGFSADQGSTASRDDGTEAFDMPPSCLLDAAPATQDICAPADAVYNLTTGASMGMWTLSSSGEPAGTTVTFSPNPAPAMSMVTMTVSGTGAAAPGMSTITITADDGMATNMTTVDLIISDAAPTAQSLISPIDMTSGVFNPNLVWDNTNGANSWLLEVDDDMAFGSPEVSETLVTNTYAFTGSVAGTTYYWRVTGINGCGMEVSPVWEFTTAGETCNTWASTDVPVDWGGATSGLISSTLNIPDDGFITDMDVTNLTMDHTWIGDLEITLVSPAGTRVDLLFDACNNGNVDNLDINFDDESPNDHMSISCMDPVGGGGTYQPLQPLSAFDGECITGTWTLEVNDDASLDTGSLNSWSLAGCYSAPQTCYADVDMDGYGDPGTEVTMCGPCQPGFVLNNQDCDDTDPAIFPGQNCEIAPIPTMGEWGIIILSFLLMIIGIASVRQRKTILG
ncbi:MAG: IPTL-CTERM sorting domain-containing protein [Saprospiraceae bacterium]|nr:IPTL-CTERM sorting domain-containing protein [Saprospiraceae bacterium]